MDANDSIQGGSIGTVSKDDYRINLMNQTGYGRVIPGNHKFDYGFGRFFALTNRANFPCL